MERESLCSEEQQILQATEDARISEEVFPFGRSAVESNRVPSFLSARIEPLSLLARGNVPGRERRGGTEGGEHFGECVCERRERRCE